MYRLAVAHDFRRLLHNFHTQFTVLLKEDSAAEWKSKWKPRFIRPTAQSFY